MSTVQGAPGSASRASCDTPGCPLRIGVSQPSANHAGATRHDHGTTAGGALRAPVFVATARIPTRKHPGATDPADPRQTIVAARPVTFPGFADPIRYTRLESRC